jgi:peptide-methionine (S)-S-oxide reductase
VTYNNDLSSCQDRPSAFREESKEIVMRSKITWLALSFFLVAVFTAVWATGMFAAPDTKTAPDGTKPAGPAKGLQQATFGSGCFWCTEAVFQQLKGVDSVVSGYSGGSVKNPTYKQVCSGNTGHAEVVQITYDPKVISYEDLLEVFWKSHDPTTKDRQGADTGTQYRSVIFYHNDKQGELAKQYKEKIDKSGALGAAIVTEITPYSQFYPAEAYHQNYFINNPEQPYCTALIRPKLEKLEKVFKNKIKTPTPK